MNEQAPHGAIGHINDFRKGDGSIDYDAIGSKIIDGPTGYIFPTIEAWRAHTSPISNTLPTDPEYLKKTTTPNYDTISQEAQARGAAASG